MVPANASGRSGFISDWPSVLQSSGRSPTVLIWTQHFFDLLRVVGFQTRTEWSSLPSSCANPAATAADAMQTIGESIKPIHAREALSVCQRSTSGRRFTGQRRGAPHGFHYVPAAGEHGFAGNMKTLLSCFRTPNVPAANRTFEARCAIKIIPSAHAIHPDNNGSIP